jgi:hypothetical protein
MVPDNTPYHLRWSERKRPDLVDGIAAHGRLDMVNVHCRPALSPLATPNVRPLLRSEDAALASTNNLQN